MKILNLGSLNFDKVYDVPHFVSEGETILGLGYAEFLGGKGLNQSLALARAGAEVYHAGAVGPEGAPLKACLDAAGVDTRYLQQIGTVSGHAIIQKCSGQNCIIVFGGSNQCITTGYIDQVLSHFSPGDVILMQNETSNVPYAIRKAKALGLKVAFNASPITAELLTYPLELVDYYIINEVEGKALANVESDNYEDILAGLAARFPHAAIVLTVGDKGVLYRVPTQTARHQCYKVKVADTTAAGDKFCGNFLDELYAGRGIPECLRQASMAAAIAVSRDGASTSIPTAEEVRAFGETHL